MIVVPSSCLMRLSSASASLFMFSDDPVYEEHDLVDPE